MFVLRLSGGRMDSGRQDKKRMNNVEEGDRISSLPDDLIHKILSFIDIKQAIETSALSSRWRSIWTSMPYLNFSSEDFPTLPKFSQFVNHVLSRRNNLIEVFSMKLTFHGKVSKVCVKKIMNYLISHNIQQLNVVCLLDKKIEFPLSLFTSQSLKHFIFTTNVILGSHRKNTNVYFITTSTWEFPALTTLYLHDVTLCDDNNDKCVGLFSKCANLKNLTLKSCKAKGSDSLSICHPRLSNLTLKNGYGRWEVFSVDAPQLKNLTLSNWSRERYLISAPGLASLLYKGYRCLDLSTDGFHSLEKVDLRVSSQDYENAREVVSLFQQFHSVKFLTLNLEIVELLSSSVELISHQPSPFANLKSLKIHPLLELSEEQEQKNVKMSTEVKNYLLDGSPGATFTMVSRKEVRAMKNTKLAPNLMAELRVLLEQEKANTETNRGHMNQGKTPMESHKAKMHEQGKPQPETKMQLQIGGSITQIKNCWEDLSVQIEQRKTKARVIISKLQTIEGLLTKLPASNRAMIQPCFSSLCAEADIVMNKITDSMKIQCDENQSRLSVCFHELATALQPSS